MTQIPHGSWVSILKWDMLKYAFLNTEKQRQWMSILTCVMTMNTAMPVDAGVESHWRGLLWDFFILTIVQPMHRLRSRYNIWIWEAMSKTNGKRKLKSTKVSWYKECGPFWVENIIISYPQKDGHFQREADEIQQ